VGAQESPASEDKLYAVQYEDGYNFVAGVLPNGEQVLIGVVGDHPLHVVAAFFDKAGHFIKQESRSVAFTEKLGETHAQQQYGKTAALWRVLEEWKAEIELRPSTIKIAKFYLPEWDYWGLGIEISDLPLFMQNHVDFHAAEKDDLDDIEEFRRNGQFVLRWGTEYWMSQEGAVTDT